LGSEQHSFDMYKRNFLNSVSLCMCITSKQGMISHILGNKGKVLHPRGTQKVKKTWKNPDRKNQTNWMYYEKQNQQVHIQKCKFIIIQTA